MNLKKMAWLGLEVIVMMGVAMIGFNVAFILFALVVNSLMRFFQLEGLEPNVFSMSVLRSIGIILLFGLIVLLMRLKLPPSFKAALYAVPLMMVYVMIGIVFYPQPQSIILGLGALLTGVVLGTLWMRKLSWHYYFMTLFDAVLGLLIIVLGIDI